MQTKKPQKRVNWIFVVILIIAIPLIIFTVIMMNTVQDQTNEKMDGLDSTNIEAVSPDTLNDVPAE
jgi:ABC-type transport system involved in cytochrome bd biosynthesis fused ATPase/permease subunit